MSFFNVPAANSDADGLGIYKFCTDLVVFDREREDNLYVRDLPKKKGRG